MMTDTSSINRPQDIDGFVERRQSNQDRRGNDRSGKFDRRRNRCTHCQFFTLNLPEHPEGYCNQHETDMDAAAFACTLFQASSH